MESTVTLSPASARISLPNRDEFEAMRVYAKLAISAQAFNRTDSNNKKFNTEEEAFYVILKGWELGLPPMEALAQLFIVSGKVSIQAPAMISLANRSGLLKSLIIPDANKAAQEGRATVKAIRRDRPDDVYEFTFSREDAQKAGLLSKITWKNYEGQMLINRAASGCLRRAVPEALAGGGLYLSEELEKDDAEVITIDKPTTPALPTPSTTSESSETLTEQSDSPKGSTQTSTKEKPWYQTPKLAELVKRAKDKGWLQSKDNANDLLKLIGTGAKWSQFATVGEAGNAILAAVEQQQQKPKSELTDISQALVEQAQYNGERIMFRVPIEGTTRVVSCWSRDEFAKMVGEEFATEWSVRDWIGTKEQVETYEFGLLNIRYGKNQKGYWTLIHAEPDNPFKDLINEPETGVDWLPD